MSIRKRWIGAGTIAAIALLAAGTLASGQQPAPQAGPGMGQGMHQGMGPGAMHQGMGMSSGAMHQGMGMGSGAMHQGMGMGSGMMHQGMQAASGSCPFHGAPGANRSVPDSIGRPGDR